MAKVCKECGSKRGTPHAADCSHKVARASDAPMLSTGGLVISKLPLSKAEADEGLRVSKATGRISLHTPMDKTPPGPCACGSGKLFSECHGAPSEETAGAEAPEPIITVTDPRQLIEAEMADLAAKLEGGSVEYADPAIDAGQREATDDDMVLFRSADGTPRLSMPRWVYFQLGEPPKATEPLHSPKPETDT